MRRSLDDLRTEFPHLGFSVYAIDPTGPVTLEVTAPDGSMWTWEGPTFTAAATRAFGPVTADPPPPPAVEPSVFD